MNISLSYNYGLEFGQFTWQRFSLWKTKFGEIKCIYHSCHQGNFRIIITIMKVDRKSKRLNKKKTLIHLIKSTIRVQLFMQQFCFAFSFLQVWQQHWSPPEWWLLFCCFLTAGRPLNSPVWAQVVGENCADWSESLDFSSQPDRPEGEVQNTI